MSIKKKGHIDPIRDQSRISEAVEAELTRFGLNLERTAVRYLEKHNSNVDGDLMGSIRSLVSRVLTGFRLQFGANAPHAIFVHDGTKPHWIGRDTEAGRAIRQWVHKKINPGAERVDQVAFFVRRKIAKEGTKAKPFLEVAMRAHINKLAGQIGRAVERGAHAG